MGINVGETLMGLVTTSGIYQYLTNPLALIMVAIACVLLYLAIVKQFEPLLLLPIAFGMLLTNLLGSDIFHEELFAGGHANWALFGGAVLIDGKDFVDSVGYMVNAAGQILTSNNVVLGHFVNAVTIDDPTKLVPFADILAQFAANGNAAGRCFPEERRGLHRHRRDAGDGGQDDFRRSAGLPVPRREAGHLSVPYLHGRWRGHGLRAADF